MSSTDIAVLFPSQIQALIRENFLSASIRDALLPETKFRREAIPEPVTVEEGGSVIRTRRGIPRPSALAKSPNDPIQEIERSLEQWTVNPKAYERKATSRIDASNLSVQNEFLADQQALARHAGWSIDRVARNALFRAYCGGNTLTVTSSASGQTAIKVASLSGFTVALSSSTRKFDAVSSANPLQITVTDGTNTDTCQVTAATADDARFPLGSGTLTVSANLASTYAARSRVTAANAPLIVRPTTALTSVDSLTSATLMTTAQLNAAVRRMKEAKVPTFPDGTYHMQIDDAHREQMLADAALKIYLTGQIDDDMVRMGAIGRYAGITFISNTECPRKETCDESTLNLGGGSAIQAQEFGAEVVNNSGINVRRSILIGMDAMFEGYKDEMGMEGRILGGMVQTIGYTGPAQVATGWTDTLERIRFHMRPPIDEQGLEVTTAYRIVVDYVVPPDATSRFNASAYKRAVVLETGS